MPTRRLAALFIPLVLALSLAACGGSKSGADAKSGDVSEPSAAAASTSVLLEKAAGLNAAELDRAAASENAALAGASAAQRKAASGVSKFSGGTRVPVYRFYVPAKSVHFYTVSEAEKQTLQSTAAATHVYEGIAFYVSSTPAPGLSPVHRYYNRYYGTHFYTISADEQTYIAQYLPGLIHEGVAFYASQTAGAGLVAVTRFMQTRLGNHLFTRSAAEAQTIRSTLAALYHEEGTAFYVIDPAYVAPTAYKLPHSGVTDQQCYQAGSDTFVACSSAGATALNSQQDGHRVTVNPMSYSEVPNPAGGNFARTECVRDNVTGLIWEGKTASGLRAGSNTYTNYDDPAQPQKYDFGTNSYVNPTQAEIDAASNSVGYVNYVNSIALCGYTDWRLPTADELQGIVDYGVAYPGPTINTAWFLNTPGYWYRSSSPLVGDSGNAWYVNFGDGDVGSYDGYRGDSSWARLVRASQ